MRLRAAKAWSIWEGSTSCLFPNRALIDKTAGDDFAIAFARIECHYFVHGAFSTRARDLLKNVGRIRHIPAVIVQGRYDVVCPMETAWALHRAWPEADFARRARTPGTRRESPGTLHELVEATDRFRE